MLDTQVSGEEARLRLREDEPGPSICPGNSRRTVFLLVGPETLLPPVGWGEWGKSTLMD